MALFLEAWRRGLLAAVQSPLLEGDVTFHWEVCGGLWGVHTSCGAPALRWDSSGQGLGTYGMSGSDRHRTLSPWLAALEPRRLLRVCLLFLLWRGSDWPGDTM